MSSKLTKEGHTIAPDFFKRANEELWLFARSIKEGAIVMFVKRRVDVAVFNDIIAGLEIPYAEVIACGLFVTEEREF